MKALSAAALVTHQCQAGVRAMARCHDIVTYSPSRQPARLHFVNPQQSLAYSELSPAPFQSHQRSPINLTSSDWDDLGTASARCDLECVPTGCLASQQTAHRVLRAAALRARAPSHSGNWATASKGARMVAAQLLSALPLVRKKLERHLSRWRARSASNFKLRLAMLAAFGFAVTVAAALVFRCV